MTEQDVETLSVVVMGGITLGLGLLSNGVAFYGHQVGWNSGNIYIILIFGFCLMCIGGLLIVLPLAN